MISPTKKNSTAFRGDTEDQDQSSSAFSRRSKSCGSSPFRNSSRISFGGGSRRNRRRSSGGGGGCRSVETHARKRFQTSPDGRGRDAAADAALVAR